MDGKKARFAPRDPLTAFLRAGILYLRPTATLREEHRRRGGGEEDGEGQGAGMLERAVGGR